MATSNCPPAVQAVLDTFSDVFATPAGLPPERPYDHAIPLIPEAAPFNSRSYRYSPAHKDEIEKQVRSMLEAGIIVPSMSPYASPVLLVQKKDGSWQFCVDFRRLNELTIKNTFPMPVIDELLWTNLLELRFFPSWISGQGTTKSACFLQMSTKRLSRPIRGITSLGSCHLGCATRQPLSSV